MSDLKNTFDLIKKETCDKKNWKEISFVINSEMKMMLNLKHDNIIKLLSFSTGIYKK